MPPANMVNVEIQVEPEELEIEKKSEIIEEENEDRNSIYQNVSIINEDQNNYED